MFYKLFTKEMYEYAFGDEAEQIVNDLTEYFETCELSEDTFSDALKRVEHSLDNLANGDDRFYEGYKVGIVLLSMIAYGTDQKEQKETN